MEAVIILLKHATYLRLSNLSCVSALTQAELHYQKAHVDLKIQQHLASSEEHSIKTTVGFIMATDIGLFILASVKIISHDVHAKSTHLGLLAPSSNIHVPALGKWFKELFLHK